MHLHRAEEHEQTKGPTLNVLCAPFVSFVVIPYFAAVSAGAG